MKLLYSELVYRSKLSLILCLLCLFEQLGFSVDIFMVFLEEDTRTIRILIILLFIFTYRALLAFIENEAHLLLLWLFPGYE